MIIYGKDYIKILYNMCIENNANIAQCSYEIVTDKNIYKKNHIKSNDDIMIISGKDAILNIFGKKNVEYTIACNKLYEKSLFNNIKYPIGKLHEDEATIYKVFYEANRVAITNLKLYKYYMRDNSITNTKYTIKRLDFIEELEEQLQFLKEKNEDYLYIMAYYRYARSLLQSYYKCKKYIEDSKKYQISLLNKYKKSVNYLINKKDINLKRKSILLFGKIFPNLYGKIFIK